MWDAWHACCYFTLRHLPESSAERTALAGRRMPILLSGLVGDGCRFVPKNRKSCDSKYIRYPRMVTSKEEDP